MAPKNGNSDHNERSYARATTSASVKPTSYKPIRCLKGRVVAKHGRRRRVAALGTQDCHSAPHNKFTLLPPLLLLLLLTIQLALLGRTCAWRPEVPSSSQQQEQQANSSAKAAGSISANDRMVGAGQIVGSENLRTADGLGEEADTAGSGKRRLQRAAHNENVATSQSKGNGRHTVWDFGQHSQQHKTNAQGQPIALNAAPKFGTEPPSLVEYSNSTGTVIACRPLGGSSGLQASGHSTDATVGHRGQPNSEQLHHQQQQQQQQQQRRLVNEAPVSISWRLVKRLPVAATGIGAGKSEDIDQQEQLQEDLNDYHHHYEQELPASASAGSAQVRFVRQDGSLVLSAFKASDFRGEIHAATYRCCLANRFGSLCSRPVHTRAVLDSNINLDVFDEFVLAGNSVALKCQAPAHLAKYLDFSAWLRDDKIIVTAQQSEERLASSLRRRAQKELLDSSSSSWPLLSPIQATQPKYLMLQSGQLYLRNASKSDAGTYKCRARHRLTGAIVTSKVGGQLMVDDSRSKNELKLLGQSANSVQWTREGSDVFMCAQVQSWPLAKFTWFKQSRPGEPRQPVLTGGQQTEQQISHEQQQQQQQLAIRQLDSCLLIQQVQAKHAGQYICEANNGDSTQRSAIRLVVSSAQLTVQLQLIQQQQLQQQPQSRLLVQQQQQGVLQLQQQQPQIVQFGANVYLNCSILGQPFDTIAWFKDTKLLAVTQAPQNSAVHNSNNAINSSGRGLHSIFMDSAGASKTGQPNVRLVQPTLISIESFGPKDRGVYQCQAYCSTRVSVNTSHSLMDTQQATSDPDFGLRAAGLGDYSASSAGDANIANQAQMSSNELGGADSSGWAAQAAVAAAERDYLRSASSALQLEVAFSRPSLGQKFLGQAVKLGTQISLQCSAFGLPSPRIVWFLDGRPIWPGLQPAVMSAGGNKHSGQFPPSATFSDDNNNLVEPYLGQSLLANYPYHELLPASTADMAAANGISGSNAMRSDSFDQQQHSSSSLSNLDELSLLLLFRLQQQRAPANQQEASGELIGDERFRISSYITAAPTSVAASTQLPMTVSQLNVSQLTPTETGQYKCLALNPLGSTQHSAQINVVGDSSVEMRTYQPANVTLIAGKSAYLQCPLIGYPLNRVDWFRGGQRLPTNHRQRIEPIKQGYGGQLELSNVDKQADGGLYTCRATIQQTGGSQQTASAENAGQEQQQQEDYDDGLVGQVMAIVRVPPLIDPQSLPELIQANEGMRTKLVCSVVQGDHPVEIRWLKRVSDQNKAALVGGSQWPGFELMQNSNSDLSAPSSSPGESSSVAGSGSSEDSITIHNLEDSCLLTFKQISYTDSADYACLAQNEVSQSIRMTRLIVNVAPSWSMEAPSDVSVLLGSRLHLECTAHGFPTPTVSWKRESLPQQQQQQSPSVGATLPASEGSRTTSANNNWLVSQLEDSGGLLLSQNSAPNSAVGQSLQMQQQQQQQRATSEYVSIVSNYRQRAHMNGSLIIEQVDQVDAGTFMCEVTNGIGTGLSKVVRVRVNVPPYFKYRSSTQLSQAGNRAELKCLVYGDQPMVVGWRKEASAVASMFGTPPTTATTLAAATGSEDIVDLVNDSRHRLVTEHKLGPQTFESILTIDNLARNDSGHYVCIVSNEFGTEETRIQLIVQEPPEAPLLMRPIRASSRQATLSFRAPFSGNSPIRKYAILFRQIVATDLDPSMATAQLPAGNNLSSSSAAAFSGQSKDLINWQQVLIDAPLVSQSSGSSSVSADSIAANKTTSYFASELVTGHLMSNGANGELSSSSSGSSNGGSFNQQLVNLNLCCLQPFTRYVVRIRAVNEIGQSEPSRAAQFITDEEPIGGPPLDVGVEATGAHSLKVRWRAPLKGLQNGLIRGYYIGYRASPAGTLLSSSGMPMPTAAAAGAASISSNSNLQVPAPPSSSSSSQNVKVLEQATLLDGDAQYQYKNVQLDLVNPTLATSFRSGHFGANSIHGQQQQELGNQLLDPLLFAQLQQQQQGDNGTQMTANNQASGAATTNSPQIFTSYLTNLRRKTAYSIIVQAYNKVGAGPRSDQIIVSTLDAAPPMSPVLRVLSVSYNSVSLIWSGRRFNQMDQRIASSNGNSSSGSSGQGLAKAAHRVFALDESPIDEDEDDDPQSYYTINFKTDDRSNSAVGAAASFTTGAGNNENGGNDDWQQRRVAKRQPMPYVLSNLRCGSHHSAFMTATNSLGQSEPGETIKFATFGAAPVAPSNSRDFLQVNSTYVVLRLSAWRNAGCIISSFILRYKASTQVKWTTLEHQVYPTMQTVTISGVAVFSTRPLIQQQLATDQSQQQQRSQMAEEQSASLASGQADLDQQQQQQQQQTIANRQQTINDLIIRNLLTSSTYKLIVEANSEAGATVAEYELETANFSTSTIAINVNGIVAASGDLANGGGRFNGRGQLRDGGPNSDSGELDFSYSGGQRSISNAFQRHNLGVWSLTILLVLVSIFMATTTLVLGFRSIMRMKPVSNSRDTLISAVLCCSGSSSASSSGADSSHSSSNETCYQLPENSMDAYCSFSAAAAAGHGLMLANDDDLQPSTAGQHRMSHAHLGSAGGGAATISGHIDACDGGELKSIMGDSLPFRQLVSSSSLTTIGAGAGSGAARSSSAANNVGRHTYTLGSLAHCQAVARRFAAGSINNSNNDNRNGIELDDDDQHQHHQQSQIVAQQNHIRAHYAATLGKQQHSTFLQNTPQPLKYNAVQSPLYGRLQPKQLQHHSPLHQQGNNFNGDSYQMFHHHHQQQHPVSSSGGTNGYETNNSIKMQNNNGSESTECQQPVYLQSIDSYQHHQQMNGGSIYGTGVLGSPMIDSNLFDANAAATAAAVAAARNQLLYEQAAANVQQAIANNSAAMERSNGSEQSQGQFHYNLHNGTGKTLASHHQQQQVAVEQQQLASAYGMIFGNSDQQSPSENSTPKDGANKRSLDHQAHPQVAQFEPSGEMLIHHQQQQQLHLMASQQQN